VNISLLLYFGVAGVFLITLVNPFYALPIFIFGHFFQPVQFFPGIQQYNVSLLMGVGVIAGWIIHFVFSGNLNSSKNNIMVKVVLLLLIWSIISTILNPEATWSYFYYLLGSIIPFFLFVYLIKTREQLITILWVLLIMGVIAALYGIYCAKANIGINDRGIVRITSFMHNPNAYAHSIVLLVPMAIAFLLYYKKKKYKLLLSFFIFSLVVGLMLSYSRNSFPPLAFFLLFTPFMYYRGNKKILAIVITIILLPIFYYALPDKVKWRYTNRILNTFQAQSLEEIDLGRVETIRAGWRMMFQNPIFGVGIGAFGLEYADISQRSSDIQFVESRYDEGRGLNAHNLYVEVGGQLGIAGLMIYLFLLFLAYKNASRAANKFNDLGDETLRAISVSFKAFIIGFMLLGLFNRGLNTEMFWIAMALIVVLDRLLQQRLHDAEQNHEVV